MTTSNTGPDPAQQRQLLLLQKEVFTIYLEPLLKLHAAHQLVTYEDLTSSWQAAVAAFSQSTIDTAGKASVRAKLTALHQSQMTSYRAAASTALTEWAETVVLPDITTDMTTVDRYLQHCRTVIAPTRPAWRDPTATRKPDLARIEARAKEAYAAHLQKESVEDGEEEEGEMEEETATEVVPTPNTAEDEGDEGEIDETADVGTDSKTTEAKGSSKSVKPSPQRSNTSKPAFVKKTAVTKPKINPPASRSVRGGRGRGSVRGGRGGNSRP